MSYMRISGTSEEMLSSSCFVNEPAQPKEGNKREFNTEIAKDTASAEFDPGSIFVWPSYRATRTPKGHRHFSNWTLPRLIGSG